MVFIWMMIAASPRVRDLLSGGDSAVYIARGKPIAIAMAVAIASARYLIALKGTIFEYQLVSCFCAFGAIPTKRASTMLLISLKSN
jgi:hypothetical protein